MTYSSCLHDQQDLCWGNTSRDTSEESQESQTQLDSVVHIPVNGTSHSGEQEMVSKNLAA